MAPADDTTPPEPASAVGRVGEPPVDGIVEPGTVATEPGEGQDGEASEQSATIPHVPIKKKGSRKR
jgi:ribonuclease E